MKFPFFASFVVFILILRLVLHRNSKNETMQLDEYWKREEQANNVRKQPLDDLKYITLDLNQLPMNVCSDTSEISDFQNEIRKLSEKNIVNLTGISNTDLKLSYGPANLELLTEYDQNYADTVRILDRWAAALYAEGKNIDAGMVLEYAVSIGSDIPSSYKLLAELFLEAGNPQAIRELLALAENLPEISRKRIIPLLKEAEI